MSHWQPPLSISNIQKALGIVKRENYDQVGATPEEIEAVRQQYEGTEQWMKAPNGEPTNLTERQWLLVRTPSFKEWFGDWEVVARIQALLKSKAIDVSTSNPLINLSGKELETEAKNLFRDKYQKDGEPILVTTKDNKHVTLGMKGVKEITRHSKKFDLGLKVIPYIKEFIKDGTYLFSAPVEKENNNKNINTVAFHYYASKVDINGKSYFVRSVIREYEDMTLYYDHDMVTVEEIKKASDMNANPDLQTGSKLSKTFVNHSIALWVASVNNDDVSKVVDENGEPLVVHHGMDAEFDVFDRTKSRANTDIQGNFFSPWEDDASGYGENVRAFFLNIKNPAPSSVSYKALNEYKGQNNAGVKARERLAELGFDGVNNDGEEYISFEPNQIKSVENEGTYSRDDANIYKQENTVNSFALDDKVAIERFADGLTYEDIPLITVNNDFAESIIGASKEKILNWAISKVKELIEKKVRDPLGNELYFKPGSDESLDEYALHMVAGMGKTIEEIHVRRAIGLGVAERTLSDPIAIVTQPYRGADGTVDVNKPGRKLYLAMFKTEYHSTSTSVVGVEQGQEGRVITSFTTESDKRHKNAALRSIRNAFKTAYSVDYIKLGLSGYSRPATRRRASSENTPSAPLVMLLYHKKRRIQSNCPRKKSCRMSHHHGGKA